MRWQLQAFVKALMFIAATAAPASADVPTTTPAAGLREGAPATHAFTGARVVLRTPAGVVYTRTQPPTICTLYASSG